MYKDLKKNYFQESCYQEISGTKTGKQNNTLRIKKLAQLIIACQFHFGPCILQTGEALHLNNFPQDHFDFPGLHAIFF